MVCTKKKFVQDKWAILGPKMTHPHNSGSAPKFSFFDKKIHLEQFDLFGL